MNKQQQKYYITTSIPYINGDPHIGHVYELLAADVLARYQRSKGADVILSTGIDEHGGKIQEKAEELKKPIREYVDEMSIRWRELGPLVNVNADRFIRTTDAGHQGRAALIWQALAGDIYKSKYSGWYCTGCESFVTEAVAKENSNVCPMHGKPYQKLEEENYFFKLSKYAAAITEKVTSDELHIIPQSRKNEILMLFKDGLQDISISRPKDKISWGIPVPGDDSQVMYVWFEALMNYITVLGYPENEDFKTFWPANMQVVGKDISRFHAAIWPGMLLGLGLPLPQTLYVHGFINIDGKKISKSLGNVVHPREVIEKYGVDALRYYLLRYTPGHSDGDFTWQRFEASYNSDLANELGNAVSRTSAMIVKYQEGIIGDIPSAEHDIAAYTAAIEDCRFDRALEEVWHQVRGLNQYIEEEKPWTLAKNNEADHLREMLAYMASCLLEIAELVEPFMPDTAKKIKYIFGTGVIQQIEGTLFPRHDLASATEE